MNALLQVKQLSQTLAKKNILHSINFEACAGQVTVILGPNGAGKTTLLKSIIGIHPVVSDNRETNTILLDGTCITHWSMYQKAAAGLGYLPQQSSLFQAMSVQDNLYLVYRYHDYWKNKEKKQFLIERDAFLDQTKLLHSLQQKVKDLSGGQQRKVEIVRSLLMHQRIILFDEPFAGVDPKSIYELKAIFKTLAEQGIAIVISDHHVDQLFSIANMVYVVLQGRVVTSGSIQDILQNNHTKDHYLGEQFYTEMAGKFL